MAPAKADWSFNRWLMKFRTPDPKVLVRAAVPPVASVVVAAVQAVVAGVVRVVAMIAIAAVGAGMATTPPRPVAKNSLKSWFTSTAFRRP
jgi:hypothetical protein